MADFTETLEVAITERERKLQELSAELKSFRDSLKVLNDKLNVLRAEDIIKQEQEQRATDKVEAEKAKQNRIIELRSVVSKLPDPDSNFLKDRREKQDALRELVRLGDISNTEMSNKSKDLMTKKPPGFKDKTAKK